MGSSFLLRVVLALGLSVLGVAAVALDKPRGPVVLTVTGKVSQKNAADGARFDMAMLEKLPQHSFTTRTPWYPEPTTFSGPLLRDVLKAAGAQGRQLMAFALNDYKTSIPVEDAHRYDMIVARLLNGQSMSVREKGPLFIIYPFDDLPELRTETHYGRSAWQLKTLQVE
jgi:hypothetical protein